MAEIPNYDHYMQPIVVALKRLGGSATIPELYDAVIDGMGLSEEQLAVLHDEDRGNQTEVGYRMAWARTYLKKAGFLTNSERGVWALTRKGLEETVDAQQVVEMVREEYAARRATQQEPASPEVIEQFAIEVEQSEAPESAATWRQQLMRKLLSMAPAAFERLCQRVLRESGFVEVRVTGRAGDGGIDGIGILRIQRVVSFQVLFQCKRWQRTVGPGEIRDFRGGNRSGGDCDATCEQPSSPLRS